MNGTRALAMASMPAAAGLMWRQYRRALHAVGAQPISAPHLPGERRIVPTAWGTAAYRLVPGDPALPPIVLIHGWGKTADAAWWPILGDSPSTLVVVDLPGHGHSRLDETFDFDIAASAVEAAATSAGLERPILVAHSMGGPVALTAIRRNGPGAYAGLVALATSAYWVRPRLRMILAMAPYAMTPRSPVLLRTARAEFRQIPHWADHLAWAYTRRPGRSLLDETAAALRRFDARSWTDLELPRSIWVVAADDALLLPEHQVASARHFGCEVATVDAQHSLVVQAPDEVARLIGDFAMSAPLTQAP